MTNKTRRTPEQAAAYYQAKANQLRAKAAQQKRNEETKLDIMAGRAMKKAYLEDGGTVKYKNRVLSGYEAFWFRLQPLLNQKDREFAKEYLSRISGIDLEDFASENLPGSSIEL